MEDEDITLPTGSVGINNILWVMLSHHAARHHATNLRSQLIKRGVPKRLLLVKQGFTHGKIKDGKRHLRYNEMTMYSFFYRWLPAVAHFLQGARSKIRCIMYVECTARCAFPHVRSILPLLNKKDNRPIKWLGFRKWHPPKPQRQRHAHPVFEGSKLIAFTRSSLVRVRNQLKKHKRLGHLDLWMSKVLKPDEFFAPDTSLTFSCRHTSVCGGSEAGPIKRAREAPGRQSMNH